MKNIENIEDSIYKIFKNIEKKEFKHTDVLNEDVEFYTFKYEKIENLEKYQFDVKPQEMHKILVDMYKNNIKFFRLDTIRYFPILHLLKILFKKMLSNNTNIEYFKEFVSFTNKINKNKDNKFPTNYFNVLFLCAIPNNYLLRRSVFNKKEICLLSEKIKIWTTLAKETIHKNKLSKNFKLYEDQKLICLAFYNYLILLSKDLNENVDLVSLFDKDLGDCVNETDLYFNYSPIRLRQINFKKINFSILEDNIGLNALEELNCLLKHKSKIKKELDDILKEKTLK